MWIALLILAALILVPPLFAEKLDAWDAAKLLLPKEPRLIDQCGPDSRVELSRWFYTYRFSGESAQAKFRGRVLSASCDRRLTVELQRQTGTWKLSGLSL